MLNNLKLYHLISSFCCISTKYHTLQLFLLSMSDLGGRIPSSCWNFGKSDALKLLKIKDNSIYCMLLILIEKHKKCKGLGSHLYTGYSFKNMFSHT